MSGIELVLAIGKNLSYSFQPEYLHMASLCGLSFLRAQWLGPKVGVSRVREKGGSFRSHIASLSLYFEG